MATGKAKNGSHEGKEGERTVAGWRGNALDLRLGAEDLDLLDSILTVVPILRILTAIGQEARRRGLKYPVSSTRELHSCLGDAELRFGDHRVDREGIARMMPDSWFPIMHEGELLSRVHIALLRCEWETAQMAPRPVLHLQ